MSAICLHTALLFRLACCVCMCVRERERESWDVPLCICVHSVYAHVHPCVFTYRHWPQSGSQADKKAHVAWLSRQNSAVQRSRARSHSDAQKQQINMSHVACSCAEMGLCLTSEKVESLEAQKRSALAQCLVSYHMQRLMFEWHLHPSCILNLL